MIEIYVHHIYYSNGTEQSFDSDRPNDFPESGLCKIAFGNGNGTVINMQYVVTISIKHLHLTEEEYEKRNELLSGKA